MLAAGAQTGDRFVVVESPAASGSKPLSAGAVRNGRLEALTVLSAEAAAELGIAGPRPDVLEATGQGSVGKALQQVADRMADLDAAAVTSVSVTASADPGEGVRDLRLLGFCVSQLPRLECSVALKLSAGYDGLEGGLKVDLSGGAARYQQIEELLLAALAKAGDVSGRLELTLTPPAPMTPDGSDWQQFAGVLAGTNPGDVKVTARLARSDVAGSTPKAAE